MDKNIIERLTDEELRLEVAKAKGWTPPGNPPWGWQSPSGRVLKNCPDWPADISAAWELVEEMGHLCWTVTIENLPSKPQEVACRVFKPYIPGRINAYAATVPLAICRCWLQWKQDAQ